MNLTRATEDSSAAFRSWLFDFSLDRLALIAPELLRGVHRAFLLLGALTMASTIVFRRLRADDGDNVSRHKLALAAASEVATAEGPTQTPR